MPITIRDVAEAAGVSPMAVSKVLHGRGPNVRVSETKANQIREVAEKLRYQPNRLATSFRTKKTDTIALVFEDFRRLGGNTGYFVQLFDGVMDAAFDRGYSVSICPKMVNFSANGIAYDGRFDGLIWCKPDYSQITVEAMAHSQIPIVALHAPGRSDLNVPQYCCDNRGGIELAVDHLAKKGKKRFAFVVDPSNAKSDEARERLEALKVALQSRNLEFNDSNAMAWSHTADEFADFWSSKPNVDALLVYGEGQAGEILKRAAESGVSIPDQLNVVGFDSTAFCETTQPTLSAVQQPIQEMATAAANRLIDMIELGAGMGLLEGEAPVYRFPCRLDVRGSSL